MELRHLRYFVVAAEEQNLHRAAERLHVSQSALSRRIHDLEVELGIGLFERRQKRIHLSAAGRAYLEDVKRILQDVEQAARRGRRIAHGEVGTLKLGFYETAVRHKVIAGAFREFKSKFKDIELKLDPLLPAAGVGAVRDSDVDAAFLYDRPAGDPAFHHLEIATGDVMLAMPNTHPLAKRREIRLRDLREEPFIWLRRETAPFLYDRLISACESGGLTPQIVQHTVNVSTRLHLVSVGMGVTFIISAALGTYWPENIVVKRVADFSVPINLDLVWRSDARSPQLDRFLQVVKRLKRGAAD